MKTNLPQKWFDKKWLLILFLFILPPIGILGIFLRNTKLWKKLVYTFFALISSMILFAISIAILFPVNYYEIANRHLEEGHYELAIKDYKKVSKNDSNYTDAQSKIRLAEEKIQKLIELEEQKQKEEIAKKEKEQFEKIETLKGFQKAWSDSILKSESQVGNKHFVSHKLILPDTILFEYTEGITKNGFNENFKIDTLVYRKHYKEQLIKKYGQEYKDIKTFISFIPNTNVDYNKVLADNKAKLERNEKILRQFSAWDGSHSKLKRWVKDNMNDPKSFKHVKTTYSDKGSYLLVQMSFRGKNAFGALIMQTVTATVDLEGNIISVE